MNDPFDDERLCGARSALIGIKPSEEGRYEFHLDCQYTRLGLSQIQVGDLIAVENYRMNPEGEKSYSVVSITQVLPMHFAAQDGSGYPGHIFESMRSIKEEWELQTDKPFYSTTTIRLRGVPTGWQFVHHLPAHSLPKLEEDDTLPMVGSEIRPLSQPMVESIINRGIETEWKSPFAHKKFEEIRVLLDEKALLTTHFGIFGFTNTGKSNLISSLVSSISFQEEDKVTRSLPNLVILDPNDEYLGLLIDKFVEEPSSLLYIHVGIDSLPQSIAFSLKGQETKLSDSEIELLRRQMKLPSELKKDVEIQDFVRKSLVEASKKTRISVPARDLASLIRHEVQTQTEQSTGVAVREAMREIVDTWTAPFVSKEVNRRNLQQALDKMDEFGKGVFAQIHSHPGLKDSNKENTARAIAIRVKRSLDRLRTRLLNISPEGMISVENLVSKLNDKERNLVVIVTGKRDSDLKEFAANLGDQLYEKRRIEGILEPWTTLLLDEADLFIPLDTGDPIAETMKDTCITLARRGRKFGLGIGISTQRASMLDTQIMGNLHTYFVSKLPRAHDRNRVAEAFGIGEEQLSPTFTFTPGHWLIISHDATGLNGVPIPVKADNANSRIKDSSESSN
ncbi:MAG: ATP-binding protein [Candidatus Thorarchaeota archaeon]